MTTSAVGIIVATIGGMAIGIERQWSGHATGPRARFAGIRTFSLLGGIAGASGWLFGSGIEPLAIVLLGAAAALVVAAYVTASRTEIDATTEVGALVVLVAGVLAGLGHLKLSSGIIALTTLFLVEKSRLHALVARIDDESLRAAVRFAVMSVVILPLLPQGPFGPWNAVRPRELWLLVLFCSGLSFAAYIARRLVGDTHGFPLAGLLGGLISSTNVTFTFARASRDSAPVGAPLASGVIAACTMLFLRVAALAVVLNRTLAAALMPYLWPPTLVGLAILAVAMRVPARGRPRASALPRNPLRVVAAVQMAAMFQLVLFAIEWVRMMWGDVGVMASGAVLGFADVDALTISMARGAGGGLPVDVAAQAVMIGVLANTVLKLGIVLALGAARFRAVTAPALAAIVVVLAGTLAFWP
jgi:uncharacterized membrane protein (DUF4010 family)